ncbi:MAG TPA: VOC family protein [Steroidobacteraceae bacterium]|nr:VOC family protein [Steroidobacteraceae bacterium]
MRSNRSVRLLTLASCVAATLSIGGHARAADQTPAPEIHFHHVHLNVTDPAATIGFYQKYFGANSIKYRGLSDGLLTEKSFLLLNKVATPPRSNLGTSLWHIGWAGVDGESEFAWRSNAGIGVQTPVTALGQNFFMYFWGPDRELIEVYTGSKNHRFEHFHLLATDAYATGTWFKDVLGIAPRSTTATYQGRPSSSLRIDNVNIFVFERPKAGEPYPDWYPVEARGTFGPTEGTALDHVAFSVRDIKAAFAGIERAGATIVRKPAKSTEFGFTSFFVRGPDNLLVEIVEEAPIPEGIWESKRKP